MERSPSDPGPKTSDEARGSRERTRQIAIVALVALAAIFALLNLDEVKVNFIVTTTRAPLFIVIVACLAVGVVLGLFAERRRTGG